MHTTIILFPSPLLEPLFLCFVETPAGRMDFSYLILISLLTTTAAQSYGSNPAPGGYEAPTQPPSPADSEAVQRPPRTQPGDFDDLGNYNCPQHDTFNWRRCFRSPP